MPILLDTPPQVHGAVYEQYIALQNKVTIELNSVTDNPLIFPSLSKTGEYDVISRIISMEKFEIYCR